MQRRLFFKLAIIVGLVLLLLIPLAMIRDVISDRQQYRQEASSSIQHSWTGPQSVIGPLLVMPYEEQVIHKTRDSTQQAYNITEQQLSRTLLIAPARLSVNNNIHTEERKRGIYTVPVYTGLLKMQGRFSNQAVLDLIKSKPGKLTWKQPYLSVLISDLRGVIHQPVMQWQGSELAFKSGSGLSGTDSGMHAPLNAIDKTKPYEYDFSMDLKLRGMQQITFSPLGDETRVTLQSAWPHPSFIGRYLPDKHEISTDGFTASWQASSFSSNIAGHLQRCADGNCQTLLDNTFGVSFVQPVDAYLQSERSVKYGVLFLSLTFVLFFLYEIMRHMAVHPVQYLLVGLALSLFFLLLVSLSEVLPFAAAYALAALVCTGLLGNYVGGVLSNARTGNIFAGLLLVLYGTLFVIISSEDNALLMGSLLLFLVLAVVMMITRRLDWYAVGEQLAAQLPERKPAIDKIETVENQT